MTRVLQRSVEDRILAHFAIRQGQGLPVRRADLRRCTGASALIFDQSLAWLRERGLVHPTLLELVQPAGASPAPTLADTVRTEAEASSARRRGAASTSTRAAADAVAVAGHAASPAERLVTAAMADPADLVDQVRRRWPDLWARNLASARAAGVSPLTRLFDILEEGLAA